MSIDIKIKPPRYENGTPQIETIDTDYLDLKGKMALDFIVRWGAVAAIPDGEDSQGRQKLKVMEPSELVDRAVLCVELATAELAQRGWMIQLPDFKEQELMVTEQKASKQKKNSLKRH